MQTKEFRRNEFGAVDLHGPGITPRDRQMVENLVAGAAKADKVDEHGGWAFGVEWTKRRGGEVRRAVNWDLYDAGRDRHNRRFLAVVQVREFTRSRWTRVRKQHFLLGRNEDASVFAHPIPTRVVTTALRKGEKIIDHAQNWIFRGDYAKARRHGDMALMPLSRLPSDTSNIYRDDHGVWRFGTDENSGLLTGLWGIDLRVGPDNSHRLQARELRCPGTREFSCQFIPDPPGKQQEVSPRTGRGVIGWWTIHIEDEAGVSLHDEPFLYCLDPWLRHVPGTHPDVAETGWWRLNVGRRDQWGDFAAPTKD